VGLDGVKGYHCCLTSGRLVGCRIHGCESRAPYYDEHLMKKEEMNCKQKAMFAEMNYLIASCTLGTETRSATR
jgi:uroporphyrinogen-III decarboxylase